MATISGSSGNDTLTGTSGNDSIYSGQGADSVDAGAGDDYVFGDDGDTVSGGNDTIVTGEGNDTVQADLGDDRVFGGSGADSLGGGGGNDYVDGGDGSDTLYGDDGHDTVVGGDGNDLIYAGAGDDVIAGGAGNDTIYGHSGADQFVIAANSGIDTIEDYNAGDGDILVIDYPGIASYADLQPYLSDDGNWGTLISFPDGSVTQVKWLNYGSLSASNFAFDPGAVCLQKGTLIATDQGQRRIESLRPGDRIVTHDNGLQPLLRLTLSRYRYPPGTHRMKPIRMKPGALGPGYPARELLISPQHRVALPPQAPERILAAHRLLEMPGVSERPTCRRNTYFHLLLARHELIRANGLWVESMLVTPYSRRRLGPLPALRPMAPVRPIGGGGPARIIAP
ncbi:Hint domain-containing protein [Tropicibacter sp. S64]|uniref:Hint domain-containing protein n=1 Tax=Tropicibacter sp. S64 TaxID=3415122 RepID=UPI003C7ED443